MVHLKLDRRFDLLRQERFRTPYEALLHDVEQELGRTVK
jgi:hypothetical protein